MAGNIDTRTEVIPATGVVNLGNANFLFVLSASGATSFKLTRQGLAQGASQENYTGANLGGLQVARIQRWDFAAITGTPGVTITFMYGNVFVKEDVTLFNQQIASVSGVVLTSNSPFASISNDTPVALPNAAQTALFAQNLTRRQISFSFVSTAAIPGNTVFARKAGSANNLYEIFPGVVYTETGTYAIDIRNDSGGALTAMIEEVS